MGRRSYTDAEKTEALALYAEQGPTAVLEQLGIPKATVVGWARANGVRTRSLENRQAHVQASALAWEQRRTEMIHEMGEVAAKALTVASRMLDAGTTSKAKDAATTMAILVDKAQLLSGAATGRTEVYDPRRRMHEVVDQLAERRGLHAA